MRTLWIVLAVLPFLRAAEPPRVLPAASCSICHTRIPPPGASWNAEESVAPFPNWTGSMMANAGTDPYWRSKVSQEKLLSPAHANAIEEKCTRCHIPAGRAMEDQGVTCTICHQIEPDGLGTPASFTGGFKLAKGDRLYGPHEGPFSMPMLHHTGYQPVASQHVMESSLCGACHTVITHPPGKPEIEFVEQGTYLEWFVSDSSQSGATCQSCHMPVLRDTAGAPARQYIAHRPPGGPFPPTRPRTPFGVHEFAGANVAMRNLMTAAPGAPKESLASGSRLARQQLAAALSLGLRGTRNGRQLMATVEAVNLTGHKLPTGFPSRRLWLHLKVSNAQGRVVYESGNWDAATGELLSGPGVQPHRELIDNPAQVQVFEAEMAGVSGQPTHSVVNAAAFQKDNRILPGGFDGNRDPRLRPVGTGPGFQPGSATTTYRIPLPAAIGSWHVQVEAVYQAVKPAHRPLGLPAQASDIVVIASAETTF